MATIYVHLLTYEQGMSVAAKPIPGTDFIFSCQWDADMNIVMHKSNVSLVSPSDPVYGWLHQTPLIPWKRIQPGTIASATFSVNVAPSVSKE